MRSAPDRAVSPANRPVSGSVEPDYSGLAETPLDGRVLAKMLADRGLLNDLGLAPYSIPLPSGFAAVLIGDRPPSTTGSPRAGSATACGSFLNRLTLVRADSWRPSPLRPRMFGVAARQTQRPISNGHCPYPELR